uniref:Uncharacterized protein n=1 Tax=Oryza glumipatula TaxID=40148 RepID=A0A0E0BMD2_9ORYZ
MALLGKDNSNAVVFLAALMVHTKHRIHAHTYEAAPRKCVRVSVKPIIMKEAIATAILINAAVELALAMELALAITDVCFYAGLRACQVKMCGAYCLKYYGNLVDWKGAYCNEQGKCCCKARSISR